MRVLARCGAAPPAPAADRDRRRPRRAAAARRASVTECVGERYELDGARRDPPPPSVGREQLAERPGEPRAGRGARRARARRADALETGAESTVPDDAAHTRRTFVRLLGFLRPYRLSLVVSIVLAVGSQAAGSLIATYLTGSVAAAHQARRAPPAAGGSSERSSSLGRRARAADGRAAA